MGALLLGLAMVVASPATAGWVCPPCGCSIDGQVFDEPGTCSACNMAFIPEGDMPRVGIVLFEGVELLDFAGPAEAFYGSLGMEVITVAEGSDPMRSIGLVDVVATHTIETCPDLDLILIPGGSIGGLLDSDRMMAWLGERVAATEEVVSVCNGALVLAELGVLEGRRATTHAGSIAGLRERVPSATVLEDVRFVEDGKITTAAGVSAGIDVALHVVARRLGIDAARHSARYMEYDAWEEKAATDALTDR